MKLTSIDFMNGMNSSRNAQEKYVSPECDVQTVSLESVCAASSEDGFIMEDYEVDEDIFIIL